MDGVYMILILTQCFPPKTGGIETVMSDLASLLKKNNTIEVLAKASQGDGEWDKKQPYPITRASGPKPFRHWRISSIIAKKHLSSPIELILTDSWKSAKTIMSLANKYHIPVITLAHGNDVLTKNKFFRRYKIIKTLERCKQIVAVSNATKALVTELGIQHCQTIHNGINTEIYLNIKKHINFDAPNLLTVARIEPRKGHDQIIKAIPSLLKNYPKIHYHIAGNGKDEQRIKALVNQLNLNDYVTFHGRVTQVQKQTLLKEADLFVMPVRHDKNKHSIEGFGISLVEAQLAGVPVLTGQAGGVNDVVMHEQTGFSCDGDNPSSVLNAIQSMLTNRMLTLSCAQKGQKRALEKFSHEFMMGQYQKLINHMVSKILI